jgi:putative methyltransferase
MQDNLKKHHVKNVRLKCLDFLMSEPDKHERVTHILLDPSCSGSGMTNRIKFGDADQEQKKDKKRLWNLEALQRRMIMHAMSFPSVEKIVYSTCSIHEEENENVVRYALDNCNDQFELVNIFEGKWNNGRGLCKNDQDLNKYKLNYCIRTSYEENLTNGFFVSCFQRKKVDDHQMLDEYINHNDDLTTSS